MTDRIYADYAATTPTRAEVAAAMEPWYANAFNASSLHAEGRRARAAIDDARETVARLLGAKNREIVFTGGGSESDNLAIFGIARATRARGRHIVSTPIEHHAVLKALDVLRDDGYEITLVPVDGAGRIDRDAFAAALRPDTVLATVMLANNEIGTIQPIAELAAIARANGTFFHTDAVQAPGRIPVDVAALGVDALALAAHKFYGPKGVGILYVRSGTPLAAMVVGGGQEGAVRAGTENVAGIVGAARAFALAVAELPDVAPRLAHLRDRLEHAIADAVPDALVVAAHAERLPNVVATAFPGATSDALVMGFDLAGVAVSAGSACSAGALEANHVGTAIGLSEPLARALVRFSFGRTTTADEIARLAHIIGDVVRAQRAVRPT
jgi:cysteine desulfurase